MNMTDEIVWEKVKNEVPRIQFDKVLEMRDRLLHKGWKLDHSEADGRVIVLVVLDMVGPHKHWLKVTPDGESFFASTFMGCGGDCR